MEPFVEARLAGVDPRGVALELGEGWQCRLMLPADGLGRVLLVPPGGLREPRTWSIAPGGGDVAWEGRDRFTLDGFACPPCSVTERPGTVRLASGDLAVDVTLQPFALRWSLAGVPLATDRAQDAYAWSRRTGTVRHAMARDASDRYFGLGDKTGPLDQHGRRFRTTALDALGYDAASSDPLYKHWPFMIVRDGVSSQAYGLYYDTLAPATFDLGCEHDNYYGLYRYVEIEDGDLDCYVMAGPRIRDVVRAFTELTGRMAFGPRWSLGYANTAMALADAPDAQAQLASFCDRARDHDIPISAFHFGSGYTTIGKRRYVFTWNRAKFPDPPAALDRFREHGMRTVANVKPCLLTDHPAYETVAARGGFVRDARDGAPCISPFWDGVGSNVDFTAPAGIAWWQEGLAREVLGMGFDAGWNDNNEYGIWQDTGESAGFGAPIPIARSRPLHALLMTRATAEQQQRTRPDERVYTVTRAGPPGIQRYAQTWSGDNTTGWDQLRWNIRMGLTMSLSGMFNTGHDVGGFAGPMCEPELLVRWTQNGAFSPRFIMNSWKTEGRYNSPWLYREVMPLVRDAIRLRYRLMPYVYSLYRRAATAGEPMLRPTFHEFEDDPRTFDDSDDFMLGPFLLVASVVERGARSRRVYLPRGPSHWTDFWTGRTYEAGGVATLPAPLSRVPLLVPAGGMIPVTDTRDFSRLHDEPSRLVRLFPPREGASQFTLYEDDGISHAHRDGAFAEVSFVLEGDARALALSVTRTGGWPIGPIRVMLPRGERRRLDVRAHGVTIAVG